MRADLVDNGMEPEDAFDLHEKFGFDPMMLRSIWQRKIKKNIITKI